VTSFDGKVAVVTGGAGGIGYAVAERLVAGGATVAIFDCDTETEKVASKLGATAFQVDVSDVAAIEAALQAVVNRHAGLHVLVNNAGIYGTGALTGDYPPDIFDAVVAVNLRGTFLGMHFGIPHIVASGGGSVVNTSSAGAWKNVATHGPYCATKQAVVSLTKTAAVEYAAKGVRVNAVLPGATETALARKLWDENPATEAAVIPLHPIGRIASPAEIAATIVFLASEEASYITGAALPVDGGYTAT
jgi:NAD(P)-dependent dehydrogenase (short-subunit alcohol dehydrogenase family)